MKKALIILVILMCAGVTFAYAEMDRDNNQHGRGSWGGDNHFKGHWGRGPCNHPTVVPEPMSTVLFVIGGAMFGIRKFRRSRMPGKV